MSKILASLFVVVPNLVMAQHDIDLRRWVREAEAEVCKRPEQCKQYLALSPKGRAVVLQHVLRRKGAMAEISEIQIVKWVMKYYEKAE